MHILIFVDKQICGSNANAMRSKTKCRTLRLVVPAYICACYVFWLIIVVTAMVNPIADKVSTSGLVMKEAYYFDVYG